VRPRARQWLLAIVILLALRTVVPWIAIFY
jgi:hypothetical protein